MKITPETARRAIALIAMYETAATAAYQCRVQLRAIEPFTDRALSAAERALTHIAKQAPEHQPAALESLAAIAAT